jgi:acetyl esterase/lipase
MRTSFEISLNPILRLITLADRGFLRRRKDITIPRPTPPSPSSFPDLTLPNHIKARIYFNGPLQELRKSTSLALHVPGGGFISMPPRCHDDYASVWARQLKGVPVLSLNYGKAPEFPYPYALEEIYDAYRSIVESNGEAIGMEGWYTTDSETGEKVRKKPIQITFSGDSA